MRGSGFKPGDLVTYCDRDHLKWGPREVVDATGSRVTVVVEQAVRYSVNASLLEKIEHDKMV